MTPYAHVNYATQPDIYKFSDNSQIGQTKASAGNSSNYRFFEIQPIKWIILNYNYLPSQYGTGSNGTHARLELLTNVVLTAGIAPGNILWKDNTINTYLNKTFNKEAFPMTLLSQTTIYNNTNDSDSNSDNSGSNSNYIVDGSNQTTQRLYLLSRYELENSNSPYIINEIFGTNNIPDSNKRAGVATDYAKAHYQYINPDIKWSAWWSRSTNGTNMYSVNSGGGTGNYSVTIVDCGTRPAMQVTSLKKTKEKYPI